jgi:deoxyribonuclease-4
MLIGAHVSSAGGLSKAPGRAAELGCNCAQIFLSGPTSWRVPAHTEKEIAAFRENAAQLGITPIFAHALYLINLASPDDRIWNNSVEWLAGALTIGGRMGLTGVVAHMGSHRKLGFDTVQQRLFDGVEAILKKAQGTTPLLMEVCAGQGGNIGARFEELGAVLDAFGRDARLGVCLDTAHLFAAGYDVASKGGLDATIAALEQHVGMERVLAVHANDSKTPFGSNVDRHANIGDGHIGLEAMGRIMTHPALKHLPFILEVPGLDEQGPDVENVQRLWRLSTSSTTAA